jgi:hypothetical protein
MKYPCIDGYIIQSNPLGPVTYTLNVPGYPNGTTVNYETSSKSDNSLQQIKIVRVVDDEMMTVTITEQTPDEIQQYLLDIQNNNINYGS